MGPLGGYPAQADAERMVPVQVGVEPEDTPTTEDAMETDENNRPTEVPDTPYSGGSDKEAIYTGDDPMQVAPKQLIGEEAPAQVGDEAAEQLAPPEEADTPDENPSQYPEADANIAPEAQNSVTEGSPDGGPVPTGTPAGPDGQGDGSDATTDGTDEDPAPADDQSDDAATEAALREEYDAKTIPDLKDEAKARGMTGYSQLNKDGLIDLLVTDDLAQ